MYYKKKDKYHQYKTFILKIVRKLKPNLEKILVIFLISILSLRILYINKFTTKNRISRSSIVRSSILDCNGNPIAITRNTYSVYISPRKIHADMLRKIEENLNTKIEKEKSFFWIKRHVTKQEANKLMKEWKSKYKNIKGLFVRNDHKRDYPQSEITSHVVGFCDKNLKGKAGAELAFDSELQTNNVELTIDTRLQYILHQTLNEIKETFDSEDAFGLITEIESGEIKALSSVPSPDSRVPITFLSKQNRNHNLDPVEAGSILKIHNAAMLLENEIVDLDSMVDAQGSLKIGKFEINDFFGKNRKMTFLESVRFSSNIATGRLALQAGAETQKRFFKSIGFLDKIEWLPNQNAYPLVPSSWGKSTVVTASYGYGIGLTSLHIVQGLIRILSGKDRKVSMYKSKNPIQENQIINKKTTEPIQEIMRESVRSSYRSINTAEYDIGGKTGTANICENGKYIEGENRVSYLVAFPMHSPKYVVIIQSTNPKKSKLKTGRYLTASNVLTNSVKKLISYIAQISDIQPNQHKFIQQRSQQITE
ncbi:penicillin-binding transpeptidase domain-containing protein [Candidatus Nesciobacter abundans]|nr:penicillin-binding transpeptidase domain-containing protein [Candidatus Nesciobacter abundans]